ncbi:MAG: MaoC domain protein dehydratase [Bradyrhizobium sp.]|nr:MaoC domain protein dehydratase [Bradyrhizobium sp.]
MSAYGRYADLHVGSRFPEQSARYEVTAQVVADYRAIAMGQAAGDAAASDLVPPTLAAVYIRPAQNALNGPPGGIHAKQQFDFFAPVRVGDTLETMLEVRELYERNGKRYVVSETVTHNQAGVLVCKGLITQVWGQEQ